MSVILKLKPTSTEEGTIIGWYTGKESTKRSGKFGGFIVLTTNGTTTRVGGGYTDDIKAQIFVSTILIISLALVRFSVESAAQGASATAFASAIMTL